MWHVRNFCSKSMFRPLWAPRAIYIRPNKIGCSAMEVHLERVNNATLNRVPISYSWPPTNKVIQRKQKYHEHELAEKKMLRKYHFCVFFNIAPGDAFVFTDLTFWGGIQVYFHFMSSHLFYAQTFPHSTITNILEKQCWNLIWKAQLTYLLICKRHRRSFFSL